MELRATGIGIAPGGTGPLVLTFSRYESQAACNWAAVTPEVCDAMEGCAVEASRDDVARMTQKVKVKNILSNPAFMNTSLRFVVVLKFT